MPLREKPNDEPERERDDTDRARAEMNEAKAELKMCREQSVSQLRLIKLLSDTLIRESSAQVDEVKMMASKIEQVRRRAEAVHQVRGRCYGLLRSLYSCSRDLEAPMPPKDARLIWNAVMVEVAAFLDELGDD